MLTADLAESLALIVPLLILVEGGIALVVWFAAGSKGGRGARIAAWLGLVTLTLWCGSAAAFVLLHALLFAFGSAAAIAGALVVTAFMLLMPFGWGVVVRHRGAKAGAAGAPSPDAPTPGSHPAQPSAHRS